MAKLEQKELIKRVCDASGEFSLNGAARLIGGLDLFISADTGPFHIAVALKTPSITLFAVAEPLASMPNYDENLHFFYQKTTHLRALCWQKLQISKMYVTNKRARSV